MPASTYRKRPIEIQALQWTGENFDEVKAWCGDRALRYRDEGNPRHGMLRLFVNANHAWLNLDVGEWVAKDKAGFYPIKDEIFVETYDLVDPDPGLRQG